MSIMQLTVSNANNVGAMLSALFDFNADHEREFSSKQTPHRVK